MIKELLDLGWIPINENAMFYSTNAQNMIINIYKDYYVLWVSWWNENNYIAIKANKELFAVLCVVHKHLIKYRYVN